MRSPTKDGGFYLAYNFVVHPSLFYTFDVQRKYGNISLVTLMIQGYKDADVKKLYDGDNVKKWAVIRRQGVGEYAKQAYSSGRNIDRRA